MNTSRITTDPRLQKVVLGSEVRCLDDLQITEQDFQGNIYASIFIEILISPITQTHRFSKRPSWQEQHFLPVASRPKHLQLRGDEGFPSIYCTMDSGGNCRRHSGGVDALSIRPTVFLSQKIKIYGCVTSPQNGERSVTPGIRLLHNTWLTMRYDLHERFRWSGGFLIPNIAKYGTEVQTSETEEAGWEIIHHWLRSLLLLVKSSSAWDGNLWSWSCYNFHLLENQNRFSFGPSHEILKNRK